MRLYANERNRRLALAVSPLVGFVGTIAGMLFAFTRIGTEPVWKTVLEAVALSFGLGVTGSSVLGAMPAVWSRR